MIRHGQASFGKANYDKLSPLGEQQARIAGRALVAQGLAFDVLVAGDMSRQQVTAEQAATAFDGAPEIQTRPAFNEYDAGSLFAAYMPRVLAQDAALAEQKDALFKDRRLFQKAFAQMTRLWLAGEPHEIENFESWQHFRQRVRDGLADIHRDFGRDARIALFTSGGPIAVATGSALGVSDDMMIQINWTIYNASFTKFQSNKNGWRLMGFNDASHMRLENDPAIITHR